MQRKNVKSELHKVISGDFNHDEERVVKYWLHRLNADERATFSEQELENIRNEIWQVLQNEQQVRSIRKISLWPRILTVAACLVIIFYGLYFFANYKSKKDTFALAQQIGPGKHTATLILADGKKIRLSETVNGEIAKEANISIIKTGEGQLVYQIGSTSGHPGKWNTLSTENSETYSLRLPDRSVVWLNAASKLSYSLSLDKDAVRKVKLEGEAFFQVAKDKAHPFVVQTGNQEVEVLGTEFNINSYHDEPGIATTLVEGSVLVRAGNQQKKIVPGEQLNNNGRKFSIVKVDLDHVVDWKNGEFNLEGQSFQTSMRKIARWYDLEVIYDSSISDNMVSGGWISRDAKLATILEGIERANKVHFKLAGRKLFITK